MTMKYTMGMVLAFSLVPSTAYAADNIIQDGTFQNAIGVGSNLTPWSDWTNAGVSVHEAPAGIGGNHVSLSKGTDLFQRFSAPEPGQYNLSFFVQNPMPWATEIVIGLQQPLGFGWIVFEKAIALTASSDFIQYSFVIDWTQPQGTPSEFYFSNSYNAPIPERGFENSINPDGTFLNVANVSFTAVPEPMTWALMLVGFGATGIAIRRRRPTPLIPTQA